MESKQVICDNCVSNHASQAVLIWFVAFAATVIGVLAWMLIK
jgi:hypothetical protein